MYKQFKTEYYTIHHQIEEKEGEIARAERLKDKVNTPKHFSDSIFIDPDKLQYSYKNAKYMLKDCIVILGRKEKEMFFPEDNMKSEVGNKLHNFQKKQE